MARESAAIMKRNVRSEMAQIRSGLRCSTIEAVFATIHLVLTQGIFLTNYVIDLGASNFICGLVEAIPFTLQFVFFLSPILVNRLRRRKPVTAVFGILHRLAWVVLIALLFVPWSSTTRQVVLILTLLLANACAVIGGNAWYSWMADLVPVSVRGSYYGRRNAYLGLTSMIGLLVGSQVLSYFRESGRGDIGYTICFSVAVASAIFAFWMLLRQYEPEPKPIPNLSLRSLFGLVSERPLLRDYIRFTIVWQFALGCGAAFFGVFMVRVLEMTPAQMGYQALIAALAALGGSRLWGKTMDRIGDRAVLIASGTLVATHILLWMLATKDFLWPVWAMGAVGGFGWAGFNIAAFSWPQRMCGEESRQHAFGVLSMLSGIGFAAGSILGGYITTAAPEELFDLAGFSFTHFHIVFLISALGRCLGLSLITRWSLRYDRNLRPFNICLRDATTSMLDNLRTGFKFPRI